jgi:uncharacterized protein with HEPN domain
MSPRSAVPRLADIIEAIEHIRVVTENTSLDLFEADWQKRWLVERGIEIISEASRHLTEEMKTRHPEIPWAKVAGIGNILRHEYERIAPDILWNVVQKELAPLEAACRDELARPVIEDKMEEMPPKRQE